MATNDARVGTVFATAGRRVLVSDGEGERMCFLSGKRAVVGDRVRWREAKGEGGTLVSVLPRATELIRTNDRGQQRTLAANIEGILVVCAPKSPPFRAGLVDRYAAGAVAQGLRVSIVLNKTDEGVPAEVERELHLRADGGIETIRCSTKTADGLKTLRSTSASWSGPWCLVGHSGVGKTSIISALLPTENVGPVGELSTFWGSGKHTTSGSRMWTLDNGAQLVDSPGIRTYAPGGIAPEDLRRSFPGISSVDCRYRDCWHRVDEEGCEVENAVAPELVASYRRLLSELTTIEKNKRKRR